MRTGRCRTAPALAQRGGVYLWLLGALLVMSIVLGQALEVSQTQAERQREDELIAIGNAYRRAIARYAAMPGGNGQLPRQLEDLVHDTRSPQPQRHLRQLYPDPETGGPWQPIHAEGGGIIGVHSSAIRRPWKQQGFSRENEAFNDAAALSDWKFIHPTAAPRPLVPTPKKNRQYQPLDRHP